jgi:two-component system cell cycle sensor histidine kinase/response regulator CckA
MYYSLKEIIHNQHLVSLSPFIFWTVLIAGICLFILFSYSKNLKIEEKYKLYKSAFHAAIGQRIIVNSAQHILTKTIGFDAFFESKKDLNFSHLLKILSSSQANAERLELAIQDSHKDLPSKFELSFMTPNHVYRSVIIHVSPILDNKQKTRILWRFDDITARKKHYTALQKEHRAFESLLNEAPVGYFSINKDGKFLFANDTFCRLINYPQEHLKEHIKLHDLFSCPPNKTAPYLISSSATPTPRFQQHKIELITSSGKIVTAYIHHELIFNTKNELIKTRSVLFNANNADKLFDSALETERKYALFFESAPNAVVMINEKLRIIDYNPAFTAAFSDVPDFDKKLKQAKLLNFIHDDDHDILTDDLMDLIHSSEKTTLTEVRIQHPNQETILQIYARNIKKTDTETQIILHFIDVTEQKLLEVQFTQSQKMQAIGQLAGGVAHDFNNLLTAIVGHCDLLLLRHRAGDPSFHDLMQVKQNANRGANLVRQLLAFSRQQTLQPKISDLTEILSDLAHLLKRLIGETVNFEIKYAHDLWPVILDQGQFEQVIINLVVNARDAMENTGTLLIETQNITKKRKNAIGSDVMQPGDYVSIKITDTGCGITPAIQKRIFDPFFSTKDIGAGTGLGLSTVYGIIRQTNGFITVDSEIDKGSTFTIYIPRYIPTAEELEKAAHKKQKQLEKPPKPSLKAKIKC